MTKGIVAIAVWVLLSFVLLIDQAKAQGGMAIPGVACAPRHEVVKKLNDEYHEQQIGTGRAGPQAILEMYASKGGSFTMIVTTADGRSCILAAGEDLEIENVGKGEEI